MTFLRFGLLMLGLALLPVAVGRTSPPAQTVTVTLSRPDRESGIRSRMVVRTRLNLRAGASPDAPVRVVIPGNTRVVVLGCSRDWCNVRYGGHLGWVIRGALYLP